MTISFECPFCRPFVVAGDGVPFVEIIRIELRACVNGTAADVELGSAGTNVIMSFVANAATLHDACMWSVVERVIGLYVTLWVVVAVVVVAVAMFDSRVRFLAGDECNADVVEFDDISSAIM